MSRSDGGNLRFAVAIAIAGIALVLAAVAIRAVKHRQAVNDLQDTGFGDRTVLRKELLRPPSFDDVSAFGPDAKAQIDAWLAEQRRLAGFPSLSVAIVRGREIVYEHSVGFADVARELPATPSTPYHVASVTKVFTATMAAVLHEQGVIDIDAPAHRFLPEGVRIGPPGDPGDRITLLHLASHQSGLPPRSGNPVQGIDGRYALEPPRLYRQLAETKLLFDPGAGEAYSNLGVGLLGHLLERATGKTYAELLRDLISDPLGLGQTAVSPAPNLDVARGYEAGGNRPAGYDYRSRLVGSGGLVSSARDLAAFLSLHLGQVQQDGQPIPGEILRRMREPIRLADGTPSRTGLGWSVRSRRSIGRIIKKNGGRHNTSAWVGFAPDHGVGVVVLANAGDPDVDPIGYWLLERAAENADHSALMRQPVIEVTYAKLAPFTAVRWEGELPTVDVHGTWYRLRRIDGIAIEQIIAFCHDEYDRKARKRFTEDLVQVLAEMGHIPERRVDLEVTRLGSDDVIVLEDVELTAENRERVRRGR